VPAPAEAISRGRAVAPGEAPWLATLVGADAGVRCGGALIAPDRVVTAAHCVEGLGPRQVRVALGDGPLARAPRVRARALSSHPRYARVPSPSAPEVHDADATRQDVALVLLARPARLPALAVAQAPPPGGARGVVYGRGQTATAGQPERPLALALTALPGAACAAAYGPRFHDPSLLCVRDEQGSPPALPCGGDSGSPFVVDGALAGVVAWGNETKLRGCGEGRDPEAFADVAAARRLVTDPDPVLAPAPLARPRVVRRGGRLTCRRGRWGGDPARLRVRWERAGDRVRCRVTATNAGGRVVRRSRRVRF
jgi:secreted trypsin-like serine protease